MHRHVESPIFIVNVAQIAIGDLNCDQEPSVDILDPLALQNSAAVDFSTHYKRTKLTDHFKWAQFLNNK